ncbi:MAG: hypothetical protein JNJ63_04110 [Hyphomonadaceae bacterium]|nr:hypothetical protein [Hyphomonadaceae bacterium]
MTTVAGQRDGMSFYETSAYWEAPLGEADAFVAAPWLEQSYETESGWRAEAVVGLKHAVLRSDETVAALQIGGLWLSEPPSGCGESGAELRMLAGHNLRGGAFINVEAATRALDGGCESERVDLTYGRRLGERWLAMGQVFLDAPRDGQETVRAQVTFTRFSEGSGAIQFGLRSRIDGDAEEVAFVLGFWGRPGERR